MSGTVAAPRVGSAVVSPPAASAHGSSVAPAKRPYHQALLDPMMASASNYQASHWKYSIPQGAAGASSAASIRPIASVAAPLYSKQTGVKAPKANSRSDSVSLNDQLGQAANILRAIQQRNQLNGWSASESDLTSADSSALPSFDHQAEGSSPHGSVYESALINNMKNIGSPLPSRELAAVAIANALKLAAINKARQELHHNPTSSSSINSEGNSAAGSGSGSRYESDLSAYLKAASSSQGSAADHTSKSDSSADHDHDYMDTGDDAHATRGAAASEQIRQYQNTNGYQSQITHPGQATTKSYHHRNYNGNGNSNANNNANHGPKDSQAVQSQRHSVVNSQDQQVLGTEEHVLDAETANQYLKQHATQEMSSNQIEHTSEQGHGPSVVPDGQSDLASLLATSGNQQDLLSQFGGSSGLGSSSDLSSLSNSDLLSQLSSSGGLSGYSGLSGLQSGLSGGYGSNINSGLGGLSGLGSGSSYSQFSRPNSYGSLYGSSTGAQGGQGAQGINPLAGINQAQSQLSPYGAGRPQAYPGFGGQQSLIPGGIPRAPISQNPMAAASAIPSYPNQFMSPQMMVPNQQAQIAYMTQMLQAAQNGQGQGPVAQASQQSTSAKAPHGGRLPIGGSAADAEGGDKEQSRGRRFLNRLNPMNFIRRLRGQNSQSRSRRYGQIPFVLNPLWINQPSNGPLDLAASSSNAQPSIQQPYFVLKRSGALKEESADGEVLTNDQ